jgi:hypothetical protein
MGRKYERLTRPPASVVRRAMAACDSRPGGCYVVMPARRFIALATLLVSAALIAGCRHATPRGDDAQSSFRFITPSRTAPPDARASIAPEMPRETVTPAEPILPLAVPVYPKLARRDRPPSAIVGVRISIDATGKVSDIQPSLLAFSTVGPWSAEFRDAVEAALAQWRFYPAELHRVEPAKGPNAGGYLTVKGSEKIEWSFDVAFTFQASGDVLSGLPK